MKGAHIIATHAELSLNGLYRWGLSRTVNRQGKTAMWIGINPSTADAELDDHSIRKLYGFGDLLGVRTWLVGNLCAFRATDVRELAKVEDPVGSSCDHYLARMIERADLIIAGWGKVDKLPRRLYGRPDEVLRLVRAAGKEMMCWGVNSDGSPRHPLMLSYETQLEPWS